MNDNRETIRQLVIEMNYFFAKHILYRIFGQEAKYVRF